MRSYKPKKKQVRLQNLEAVQHGNLVPWSDTWVKFNDGRRVVKLGPCFLSRSAMDSDRELFSDDPDKYGYIEPRLPTGDWFACPPFDEPDNARRIPNIAVNVEWLGKRDIERAVEWYLRTEFGVTAPLTFRWQNFKTRAWFQPW